MLVTKDLSDGRWSIRLGLEGDTEGRVRQLIQEKYKSLDRFYLETDFSKGHLSDILRGKGSPTVGTLAKLAKALDVEVRDFFVFPERGVRDRAMDLLREVEPQALRRVLRILTRNSEEQ